MWGLFNVGLLVASIIIILFIASVTKRHGRLQDAKNRRFLEEEQEANLVRKRELDPELYFVPDLGVLPTVYQGDPHKVVRASIRTMVRFTEPISNVELKKMYGVSQLDSITQYEENYHDYLRCLGEWAEALAKDGRVDDALEVLSYAVELGTEFRAPYKLMCDLYLARRDRESVFALLEKVGSNHFTDPAMRQSIKSYIREKLSELSNE